MKNRQLEAFIERIERLEEEKRALADDVKSVYTEAKDTGFDPKIMREIIKLRRMEEAERNERQALLDTYMHELGMLADTPLGQSALERQTAKLAKRANALGMTAPTPELEAVVKKLKEDGATMTVHLKERERPPTPKGGGLTVAS